MLNKIVLELKEKRSVLIAEFVNSMMLMIPSMAFGIYFTNLLKSTKTVEEFVIKTFDYNSAEGFVFYFLVAAITFSSFYLVVKKFNIQLLVPLSERLMQTLPQSIMLFGAIIASACFIPALYLLLNGDFNHEFRFFFASAIYCWFIFFIISFFIRIVINDVFKLA